MDVLNNKKNTIQNIFNKKEKLNSKQNEEQQEKKKQEEEQKQRKQQQEIRKKRLLPTSFPEWQYYQNYGFRILFSRF